MSLESALRTCRPDERRRGAARLCGRVRVGGASAVDPMPARAMRLNNRRRVVEQSGTDSGCQATKPKLGFDREAIGVRSPGRGVFKFTRWTLRSGIIGHACLDLRGGGPGIF